MHGPRAERHVVDPVAVGDSMEDRSLEKLVTEADADNAGVSLGYGGHVREGSKPLVDREAAVTEPAIAIVDGAAPGGFGNVIVGDYHEVLVSKGFDYTFKALQNRSLSNPRVHTEDVDLRSLTGEFRESRIRSDSFVVTLLEHFNRPCEADAVETEAGDGGGELVGGQKGETLREQCFQMGDVIDADPTHPFRWRGGIDDVGAAC